MILLKMQCMRDPGKIRYMWKPIIYGHVVKKATRQSGYKIIKQIVPEESVFSDLAHNYLVSLNR